MGMKYILAVDDSPTILKMIQEMLATDNITVKTCVNGEDAKRLLQHENFDLVISDEEMPKMTGSELAEWFRTRGGNTTTPFVIVSGKNDSQLFGDLMSKNFINAMFPKPFQFQSFINVIYTLLGIQNNPAFKASRKKN
jgi:CheY-like chemotaxis protein